MQHFLGNCFGYAQACLHFFAKIFINYCIKINVMQFLHFVNKNGQKEVGKNWIIQKQFLYLYINNRYRPRFFDQVGHQTMSAYIEKGHFFTKSCHRQTYQNYEQPPQSLQNLYIQSHFSASKINRIFLNFFFL